MATNPKIFKTYDIRGVYKKDLDEDTAYSIGLAFANLISQESKKSNPEIVVGGDMRLSTPELKKSLVQGLVAGGSEVVDIGMISTPTFYFGVGHLNSDGGVMVSASHNPGEWNGFKLTREKAKPVSFDTGINLIKENIETEKLEKAEKEGSLRKKEGVLKAQMDHDFSFFDPLSIKPLKVVADPANGMGAQFLEAMFERLDCELVKMNFELDGTFPAHEADPLKPENMEDLKHRVKQEGADIGIAVDGDGDRVFFVDNKGESIDQSIIRGILAKIFLKERPGSKICYDIRPGKITEDMIRENGGTPVITKVGHSLIKEQTLEESAYFAGESSGHFFLNMDVGCFEVPVIIIGKLLQEFSQNNITSADYIEPLKKYHHSGEINSEVEDKEEVFKVLEENYSDGEINKLDGVTIEYPDFWFNVRGSNTEEKVRLNLEARDKETMEEKRDEVLEIIRKQ